MKIACITGDVHHPLSNSWWDKNEVRFAREYVRVLMSLGAKSTLFVTGKCVKTNEDFFRKLSENNNIELGGHTYFALRPRLLHLIFRVLCKSTYGPKFYQRADISRTMNAFKKIGVDLKTWRTHAYAGDKNTYSLLNDLGFTTVSDLRRLCKPEIEKRGSICHIPITMPPDEVISPSDVAGNELWKGRLWRSLKHQIKRRNNVVFQLHPKRMKMLDNFRTFSRIIRKLKEEDYTFLKLNEMVKEE